MKQPFLQKLKTFAFEYAGFIFSVKKFWTAKKIYKSYAWTPSISNLAILCFFCKIWPTKVWKCNETKGLIFITFYVFGWWKLSLKVMEASSMYIGEGWVIVTWSKTLNLKNNITFLYIKSLGSILFVTVLQNPAVSISRHYTMVHHNME